MLRCADLLYRLAFGAVLPAVHGAMALLAASLSKETLDDGTVPYTL